MMRASPQRLPLHAALRRAFVVCLLATVTAPAAAPAQLRAESREGNLVINAALGSAVGGARALIARRPVLPALARGAGGGLLHGAGKWLAAENWPAAGLVARGVSAAGISLIGSAERDTLLLMVPLGVVTLYWEPRGGEPLRARVNLHNTWMLVEKALSDENRLDLAATLETGAPVFRHDGLINGFPGFEVAGLIQMQDGLPEQHVQNVLLPHETIHILQEDAWNLLVALPIERSYLSAFPYIQRALPYVDPGFLTQGIWSLGNDAVDYYRRPWEVEAYFLTEGRDWREQFRRVRPRW